MGTRLSCDKSRQDVAALSDWEAKARRCGHQPWSRPLFAASGAGGGRTCLVIARLLSSSLLTDVSTMCRFLGPSVELRYSHRRRHGHTKEP